MNKQEFDALGAKEKAVATEAYIDGFKAAIDLVGVYKVGKDSKLEEFRQAILANLKFSYEAMKDYQCSLSC